MRFRNEHAIPAHLFDRLSAAYHRMQERYDAPQGPRDLSVTTLVAPAQARQIMREYKDELEMEITDVVPLLRGAALHHILEDSAIGDGSVIPEERLHVQHDGWNLSGKPDLFVTNTGTLTDYKDSSVWAYIYDKPDWIAQLNCYDWLARRNGLRVTELEVDLFVGDWRRSEARRMGDYPPRAVAIPIPHWTPDVQTDYIDRRLARHRADVPPPCTPEERWAKPDTWAVKKDGNKKAAAVYDSEKEAVAALKPGYLIEHRPGESVRCASYCLAKKWCLQAAADPTLQAKEEP